MGIRSVEASHAGGCMLIDPLGQLAGESHTRDIREEMLVADLDGDLVAKRRRSNCFNLQTRRPGVFAALTEPTG